MMTGTFLNKPKLIFFFSFVGDSECEITVCNPNDDICRQGFTGDNCNVGEYGVTVDSFCEFSDDT